MAMHWSSHTDGFSIMWGYETHCYLFNDELQNCTTEPTQLACWPVYHWMGPSYKKIHAPTPYSTWHGSLFGPTGCWGHGLASSESRHEPYWACVGSNVSLDQRHGWTPFHRSWIKQCCPPGVGCSSARKGADPGQVHASLCQGSSGR